MRYVFTLLLLAAVWTAGLYAQDADVPSSEDSMAVFQDMFNREEPLEMTLAFDQKLLKKNRRKEEYQPAEMTLRVSDDKQLTYPVRIKSRGIMRKETAMLPPFWLNIRDSGVDIDSITDNDIRRMKMVIRYKAGKAYDYLVLREYLIYKLYNIITPLSFRARLVRLKYVDTSKDNKETDDWAFLIEPIDLLALRLNGMLVESDKFSVRTVNAETLDQMALFCYMIGDQDYSITGQHNVKIITLNDQRIPGYIPITYDFDYTGLVDAPYAVPTESTGTLTVKERYYWGACRDEATYKEGIARFMEHKDKILEYVNGFEYMPEDEREEVAEYLLEFFEEAAEDRFIERSLVSTCR